MDSKLEKRYHLAIRKVNGYLEKAGNSAAKLAPVMGMSPSTLSPFLNGTYQGNLANVCEKIEAFFDLEKERLGIIREPEFVNTRQSKSIWRFITLAHAYDAISVIVGDSGLGKTRTLHEYAKKPGVFYVKCHPYMRGKTGFLQQLCLDLNIRAMGNQILLFNRLAQEASQKGALIILDDAQTLNQKYSQNTTVFESIRALHDMGVGFAISGNSRVRDSVTQNDCEELYQQFAARSEILMVDSQIKKDEFIQILDGWIYGRLGDQEIEYLFGIANGFYGSLHIVRRALILAFTRAKAKKIELSLSLLKDATNHIISQRKPEFTKPTSGAKLNAKKEKADLQDHQPVGREEGPARAKTA